MAKLIYSVLGSLDGYFEDADGRFDWAAPDEEVHAFVNDLERPIGTYLCGRRMYETMVFWETGPLTANRRCSATSRRSGGPRRRSCTHGRFDVVRARGHGSSASSTRTRSGG